MPCVLCSAPRQLQEAGSADWARRRPRTTGRPVHYCGTSPPLPCPALSSFLMADVMINVTQSRRIGPHTCPGGQDHSVVPARSGRDGPWTAGGKGKGGGTPIALPKDLTCSLQKTTQSIPTPRSIGPPDGRYRPSVVEERGEARVVRLDVGEGVYHSGFPSNPGALYQHRVPFLQEHVPVHVQFYPEGTYCRLPRPAIT